MGDIRSCIHGRQMAKAWMPGSYTPARCALWRTFDDDMKARLTKWIMAEKEAGNQHSTELPIGYSEPKYVEQA